MDATKPSAKARPVRVAATKPKARALLIEEHRTRLVAVARRLSKSAADADDLVQDTIERALRSSSKVPDEKLRSWMTAVLNNLFIDQCRRRTRRPSDGDDAIAKLPAPPLPPPPKIWHSIDGAQLRAAVDELQPEFAQVYRLHAFERRSYAEISKELGLPVATVGTRLLRARKKLKKSLLEQAEKGMVS